eukprot:gnl/TRDRNA2_/TRDRNA2_163828_c1_seq2.p1 gnl/TRDRNA2_/TRDRNA2_163828_c1~~gnl/TRDRNA2_/TRDRNA2_163828_c1_seq2.p1  ORF type:complete len:321 (+),score=49.10 gnl/TRDRNA2_/TRDRNA2_163828_c1_seq2:87-1049(+)
MMQRRRAARMASDTMRQQLNAQVECSGSVDVNLAETEETKKHQADKIDIQVKELRFRYDCNVSRWNISAQDLKVSQGSMVAVIGLPGCGKSTFMSLLGGVLDPEEGQVFVPPHLRRLHVCKHPIMTDGSMWANLTFGGTEKPSRVRRVLQRLHLDECIRLLDLELADTSLETGWRKKLSESDIAMIHLARALVLNPNVLVIHKPSIHFEGSRAKLIMEVLNPNVLVIHKPSIHFEGSRAKLIMEVLEEFVMKSGVAVDGDQQHRRPRTVFYSSDVLEEAQLFGDIVWEVQDGQIVLVKQRPPLRLRRAVRKITSSQGLTH